MSNSGRSFSHTISDVSVNVFGDKNKPFSLSFYADGRSEDALEVWRKHEKRERSNGVLVIYTGGTIGSAPRDEEDPDSPQIVYLWDALVEYVPQLNGVGKGKINFKVDAVSFKDPLDSANVGPKEWSAMARIIERYQDSYDGFVIAHGTDTLVYSASALSFILHNLKQPVILTGAQLSAVARPRNDGVQNLVTAIMIANPTYYGRGIRDEFAEVCIYFGGKLLRGNRAKKIDADGFAAFDSPNYDLLGTAGSQLHIYPERFSKLAKEARLEAFNKGDKPPELVVRDILNTRVVAMDAFPGIQNTNLIGEICGLKDKSGSKQVEGLVLRTYGTGNVPDKDPAFLSQIDNATKNGIKIINVTQCQKGGVEMGLYETSAVLEELGVCSGADITSEAALCKVMVILGHGKVRQRLTPNQIHNQLQSNLVGEQSQSLEVVEIGTWNDLENYDRPGWQILPWRRKTMKKVEMITKGILRFTGAVIECQPTIKAETPRTRIKIWIGAQDPEDFEGAKFLAGSFNKEVSVLGENGTPKPKMAMFDITATVGRHLKEDSEILITIELEDAEAVFRWETAELVLHRR